MNSQIISYETAKIAKEKGFDNITREMYSMSNPLRPTDTYNECCYRLYGDYMYAPTQTELVKWLREQHYIHIIIEYAFVTNTFSVSAYSSDQDLINEVAKNLNKFMEEYFIHKTYEDALEEGLKQAFNLIK